MALRSKLTLLIGVLALGSTSLFLAGGTAGGMAADSSATMGASTPGVMIPTPGSTESFLDGVGIVKSTNWSGYAQSAPNGTYTAIVDSWTVPKVTTNPAGSEYDFDWVGIDGYSNDTLVQAGTESNDSNGTANYEAWTEIIPASSVVISGLTIHPGDKITTTVQETAVNVWSMEVQDITTGKSGGRIVDYDANGADAETIHERPTVGGSLSTLANTTNVTFTPGEVSTAPAGSTPVYKPLLKAVTGAVLHRIYMTNNSGTKTIAIPSTPSSNKEGFAVADGSTAPPAP
jgi:hypothetical protein